MKLLLDTHIIKQPPLKFYDTIKQYGIKIVNTEINHILIFNDLNIPTWYKDPFDHLIISTAISGKFTLISADGKFPFYRSQDLNLIEND